MNQIRILLRQKMGLHAATVGLSLVDRAARARMEARRVARQEDYAKLLHGSRAEWNALIESVVTTETWFFRDRQAFATLVKLVTEKWMPANPTGVLRLLSLPCSSGEEPYSIAMALLDAGVAPERFRIDAIDISACAIAVAQRGVYGRHSFRGTDLEFRERHFQRTCEGYALNANVREPVRFQQGNLMEADCLPKSGVYDFIFCRHLLIYFDSGTQRSALERVSRALTGSGVLFLGSAEVPVALKNSFVAAGPSLSFACRPAPPPAAPPKPALSVRTAIRRARVRRLTRSDAVRAASARSATREAFRAQGPAALSGAARVDLEDARRLSDAGRLAEAAEICEAHIREQGVSAHAYNLLGRIRGAAGADSQAAEFYRRALYLEPAHYDTLVRLASLSEKSGDAERARILQERAKRAAQESI